MGKRVWWLLVAVLLLPVVFGHTGYVLSEDDFTTHHGSDVAFLESALQDPFNVGLILLTLIVVALLYIFIPHLPWCQKEFAYMKEKTKEYRKYIPWIARLGVGIALIGAGSQQVLLTPYIAIDGFLGTLQILLGFFILAGFFTGPATIITICLYLLAVLQGPYMLGNMEFLALLCIILALHEEQPGVDDVVGIPFMPHLYAVKQYAPVIARWGIGFALAFLAVYEKFLNPQVSALVVEQTQLMSVIPVSAAMWVLSAGVIEFVLGIALLIGYRTRIVSAITFLVLSLSFFYFGEEVYAHVTLFALLSIVFIYGNDPVDVSKKKKVKQKQSTKVVSVRKKKRKKR